MMPVALAIVSILLLVSVALCIALWIAYRHLQRRSEALLNQHRADEIQSQTIISNLRAQITAQDQAKQQSQEVFKALAGDALKQNNEQFLQLAKQNLAVNHKEAEKQLEQRKMAIEAMVQPLSESLKRCDLSLQQIEQNRKQAYGSLTQQVGSMIQDQKLLRQETNNLVSALRRPEVRGRWGEMLLERVVELAGMVDHCHFRKQESVRTEDGLLRPDLTVYLPGDRRIIVDAKTIIDAYLDAVDMTDDEQRHTAMQRHVQHIETQVKLLSDKDYASKLPQSPDLVILFIPGESFLYAATHVKPTLIESAMEKGVLIATPTILIGLLKAIALGWNQQQLAQNAEKISELGKELLDRLRVATEHLGKVGDSLESAVSSYNAFISSLESRVMVSARKFEQFGVTTAKALPTEIKQVDLATRTLRSSDDPF